MIRKRELFEIIFGVQTRAGKLFDIVLLWVILLSVLVVILDSVSWLSGRYYVLLVVLEWTFTIIFTLEYALRVYVVPNKRRYIFSFWGLIDLISFLPTFLSLLFVGSKYLVILRIVRLLRVFKIYQMTKFLHEYTSLYTALKSSVYKIAIFMALILVVVVMVGTIMFVVEGNGNDFTSIPQSIYWAIITITTVGYGDIVPTTILGKFIASFMMLIGYSIIAVPTGIVTFEMTRKSGKTPFSTCPACKHRNPSDALFCNYCGERIQLDEPSGKGNPEEKQIPLNG